MPAHYALARPSARQIALGLEEDVAAGTLSPGDLLTPIRSLAVELGVSPNTVAAAYRMLRERGTVETAGRRGTRIRLRPPSAPRNRLPLELPTGARDLSDGRPAQRLLPDLAEPMRRAAMAAAGQGYGGPDLSPRLADSARHSLSQDGVPAEHLAVTSSTLDAIERVLLAHVRPGDRIVVEDPAWASLVDLLAALGLVVEPVPLDEEGLLPGPLRQVLSTGARAIVMTGRAQVPTGAAVTPARARALRRVLAGHRDVLVVEDDHAAGIAGAEASPLAGASDAWAFVRSVSKAWGPDLRVALLAGDATTIDRVRGRQRLGPGWVSHLAQETVVELWDDQDAVALVGHAERSYEDRRRALVAALLSRGVAASAPSGINVWVPVADETNTVMSLLGQGWAVAAGSRFRLASGPGIRVTIATLDASEVDELAEAVARAVASGPTAGV